MNAPLTVKDLLAKIGSNLDPAWKLQQVIALAVAYEAENAKLRAVVEAVEDRIIAYKLADHDLILTADQLQPVCDAIAATK
jgi:hypothetical protein